jgi:hypothetical protein
MHSRKPHGLIGALIITAVMMLPSGAVAASPVLEPLSESAA